MRKLACILLIGCAFPAAAQNKDSIDKAVARCVELVHKSPGTDMEKYSFSKFDAYYNPATGAVMNNVIYADDQLSLFKFNKCMVNEGFPLGAK